MADDALIQDPQGGMPRLLEIMRRLRDPEAGCPWDIEQDFSTIAPYTIEEAYEVADAIERQDWGELKGELGDLLFQSVFHAQMAQEAGLFDFDDVANTMSDKMVARHPHVFGAESRDKSPEQQTRDWEAIKAAERAEKAQKGALDGVAVGLPALLRAFKLQKRAARVGFDWPETEQVLDKIAEEPAAGQGRRGDGRSALCHGQSRTASGGRPRGRAAPGQCKIHAPFQIDRGRTCSAGQINGRLGPGRDGCALGRRQGGRTAGRGMIRPRAA